MSLSLGLETALALAVFITLAYFGLLRQQVLRQRDLPPGPPPFPILGNIPQMSLLYPEKQFAQWRNKYGDTIFLKMFNTPVLVINSVTVARELLNKRSAIYSSRPYSVLQIELLGWEHDFGLIPYNEELRRHRRWMYLPFFAKSSLDATAGVQRNEVITLLKGLLRDPLKFESHIHRYSASSLLQYIYGHKVVSDDDEYLHIIETVLEETMNSSAPGAAPVDFLPFLKHTPTWFPGADFKRRALRVKSMLREAAQRTFALAAGKIEEDVTKGAVLPSLIRKASANGTLETEKPELMMFGLTLYGAGTDTTVIKAFVLAMVLYPDLFAKAREELDRVIGCNRLPNIHDRDALPYLECVLKETLRFSCPTPLGVPHATSEDDEYRGYCIPKGTTVIPNLWLMLHDPEVYPDPEAFRPERFDGVHVNDDPRGIVFGFGRRICPGRRFADSSVWQAMANIIVTFDIRKARDAQDHEITPAGTFSSGLVSIWLAIANIIAAFDNRKLRDEDGNEITPPLSLVLGSVSHPRPFKCSVTPRTEAGVWQS
ncbi:cytochrome P450 [Daedalea quercina L-15889]|uniref:Cytochrome P450 n=1 Tax=Daedalea quercina L-15889 TaxID=1314783 RepID=A0A165QF96_9APHY|nr:cytochrome P450 [Daedalea quercina L-15889]